MTFARLCQRGDGYEVTFLAALPKKRRLVVHFERLYHGILVEPLKVWAIRHILLGSTTGYW